jgi:DtxR family transcriptional regulator, Mn-dependent transcriptional regulator
MECSAGLELTPRKVDYLKYIFEHGGTIRTTDIALHFTVDPSTITKTIGEMAEAGYLNHTPYRGVALTETGRQHAAFLVKRHRILSLVFTRNGLSEEQACREVIRFESFISRDAVDTICRAMGHPMQGSCGAITHDDGCMSADAPRKEKTAPGTPAKRIQP